MHRKYEVWVKAYDPANYKHYIARMANRYDKKEQADFVVFEIKRGTTTAIKTVDGKWIDRDNILDISIEVYYC